MSSTIILRLVDKGILGLDEKMSKVMTDRNGMPWSGNMGDITLRRLLSFTSGISGEVASSNDLYISLAEAVNRIYDDQSQVASLPGSYFYYGGTHLRIAARYAEIKTGKTWKQIYDEQMRIPLGWAKLTTYENIENNPNPVGGLETTGLEYMRFMMLQLCKGYYGHTQILSENLINEQRKDQFLPSTVIESNPYTSLGYDFHYGLGNWRECPVPDDRDACDSNLRISSTGVFGWAPWIDTQADYAAVIMTRQPYGDDFKPSEKLKAVLADIIPKNTQAESASYSQYTLTKKVEKHVDIELCLL